MRVLALAVVLIGSLYELGVQALALAWFWGGYSTCERAYLLFPVLAVLIGAIALLAPRAKAALLLSSAAVLATVCGLTIGGMANSRSELLCGAPLSMNYSWTFFVVVAVLGVWSGWRLAQRWLASAPGGPIP
jgi:hypothetical protein